MTSHTPSDKDDLKTMVRGLTRYADSPDELPESELDTLIDVASMELVNETGSDAFYNDDGLTQALVFATCIHSKAAVENYSVDRWSVGADDIDVSGAGDADQIQFESWHNSVKDGLAASEEASSVAAPTNINSANYVG